MIGSVDTTRFYNNTVVGRRELCFSLQKVFTCGITAPMYFEYLSIQLHIVRLLFQKNVYAGSSRIAFPSKCSAACFVTRYEYCYLNLLTGID